MTDLQRALHDALRAADPIAIVRAQDAIRAERERRGERLVPGLHRIAEPECGEAPYG